MKKEDRIVKNKTDIQPCASCGAEIQLEVVRSMAKLEASLSPREKEALARLGERVGQEKMKPQALCGACLTKRILRG
jgi:hypothetical protein